MVDMDTDVRYIRGVGEQRAKSLGKLGINTLRDLVGYFPRAYDDRRKFCKIGELCFGECACVEAMVVGEPVINQVRKGLELVKVRVMDETGTLDITFFNQTYMKNNLRRGEVYTFFGKADGSVYRRTMNNPLVERRGMRVITGRIVPIYPLTSGVNQGLMIKSMEQGLAACRGLLLDSLPAQVRQEHNLCSIDYAYSQIHFPDGEKELSIARRRLGFEELFLLTIGLKKLRRQRDDLHCTPYAQTDISDFYSKLPFTLTGAQKRTIDQILADLRAGRPMNRLVQGDVGSGKTMVAAAAMVCAVRNGFQAALMAPTEILAEQHYHGLAPLFERMDIPCLLLTGAMTAKNRREVLSQLENGQARVIIGTHALISADVNYDNLGLVVTDEQHRFGVDQRAALSAKGSAPHLLVMSATPIPRTLALMIYGDLDVSIIDELPPGRQKIDTFSVTSNYRQRFYRFVRKEVEAGRQAYMICSMVEKNEAIPDDRKAVTEYAKQLQEQVFPGLTVAYIHGRMKPKEKEKIMAAFAAGELHILVSTTVVEVGVDVPNATVMVIENAERFGLSQLHQLRGRIGRGQHKSYCILVSDNKNQETRQRLEVMTRTTDGFKIAEEDLRLRGPGDFLGRRQHGLPALKVANLSCDMILLQEAQAAAEKLLREDPELEDHPITALRITKMFELNTDALN